MTLTYTLNIHEQIKLKRGNHNDRNNLHRQSYRRDLLPARRHRNRFIGLAGNGRLIDWEIFGHPNKGSDNGHTHFAVKAERDGKLLDARVLCGDVFKNLAGQTGKDYGFGLSNTTMQGFPHFRDCVFRGEFPVAEVSLDDPDSPISVKLTAFNPFIPQNAKDSSIPAALFETEVTNKTGETIDLTLAGTLRNPSQRSVNLFTESGAKKGILLSGAPEEGKEQEPDGMALFTDAGDVSYQENWYRGGWYDYLETYWRNFTEMPRFVNRHYETPGNTDCATLAAHMKLSGRSSEKIRFVISWYYPMKRGLQMEGTGRADVRNYYSYIFESAGDAAGYVLDNWKRLRDDTFRWHDELFACTLPEEVIEAVSATSSVLKSETSIRFGEKGDFYGWEGLGEHGGSCPGTCTHVWNYAYAMPFLFPELGERAQGERLQVQRETGRGHGFPDDDTVRNRAGRLQTLRRRAVRRDNEGLPRMEAVG